MNREVSTYWRFTVHINIANPYKLRFKDHIKINNWTYLIEIIRDESLDQSRFSTLCIADDHHLDFHFFRVSGIDGTVGHLIPVGPHGGRSTKPTSTNQKHHNTTETSITAHSSATKTTKLNNYFNGVADCASGTVEPR